MKSCTRLCSLALALSFMTASQGFSSPSTDVIRYRLTIQNVTADNRISPYLSFVHKASTNFFALGSAASEGLAEIAETGSTRTLERELSESPIVLSTKKAEGGPLIGGEKRSLEFEVPRATVAQGARLTVLAMIGRSNDSFIALRGLELRTVPKGSSTFKATNYDAGSEENTGNVEDFGSAGHPVGNKEGLISADRGLNLRGNAPETFAWGSTAAIAVLERLN